VGGEMVSFFDPRRDLFARRRILSTVDQHLPKR
jgi:hypothetical protein